MIEELAVGEPGNEECYLENRIGRKKNGNKRTASFYETFVDPPEGRNRKSQIPGSQPKQGRAIKTERIHEMDSHQQNTSEQENKNSK